MSEPRRYIELILANRIFAALAPADAAALYKAGDLQRFPAAHTLFEQGDSADGFFLILAGSLGVVDETRPEVADAWLATLGVGETVGEMGLVMAGPRSATVVAEEATLLWHLPGRVFEDLLRSGDRVGTSILRGVGRDMCRRFRKVLDEGERLVMELEGGDRLAIDSLGWDS